MDGNGRDRWIGRIGALADETRARLLLVLDRHELSVTELCAVVQLPQSTVSRHLRLLGEEGWVAWRADGASRYYRLTSRLDAPARKLWAAVREPLRAAVPAAEDAERARQVLQRRRSRSEAFFSTAADQWDALRVELFGAGSAAAGLLGLLPDDWTVGDLGCGTGGLAAELAPFVARVIGVDRSPEMLAAAARRTAGLDNVALRVGELESLPVEDGVLDAAVLSLVLHYVAEPAGVLAEAARTLRPGGRLLVVDMAAHDRAEYRDRMGHVWLGFETDRLAEWLDDAGFGGARFTRLPADPRAKGPLLFAATAWNGRKRTDGSRDERGTDRADATGPRDVADENRSKYLKEER
jgi:SAM-dependent methyltransferase